MKDTYMWNIIVSFYTHGVCGGQRTLNVLADSVFEAIERAKRRIEADHNTKLQSFELEKLEKVCRVNLTWPQEESSDEQFDRWFDVYARTYSKDQWKLKDAWDAALTLVTERLLRERIKP